MNILRRFLFIQFLLTVALAQFDWDDNGVPVRQGVHIEWQRSGDVSPNGDMIFSWSDTRNGIRDVFVQKVSTEGEKLWGSEGIAVVTADGRQEDPILIADNEGGAFIIWADYKNEPDTEGDILDRLDRLEELETIVENAENAIDAASSKILNLSMTFTNR